MNSSSRNISITSMDSDLNLTQVSIQEVRAMLPIFIIYFFTVLTNGLLCLISLKIFSSNKNNYKTRTYTFLRIFFFNDALLSTYYLMIAIFHLFNVAAGLPELYTKHSCYLLNGVIFLFIRNNVWLALVISVDRLLVLIRKSTVIIAHKPITSNFLLPMLLGLFLSITVHGLTLAFRVPLDDSKLVTINQLPACIPTNWVMDLMTMAVIAPVYVTFFIYSAMLIMAQLRWYKLTAEEADNIVLKRSRKLTKVLGYTSLAYFLIGPTIGTYITYLL